MIKDAAVIVMPAHSPNSTPWIPPKVVEIAVPAFGIVAVPSEEPDFFDPGPPVGSCRFVRSRFLTPSGGIG
jgi:hypothetical protein